MTGRVRRARIGVDGDGQFFRRLEDLATEVRELLDELLAECFLPPGRWKETLDFVEKRPHQGCLATHGGNSLLDGPIESMQTG